MSNWIKCSDRMPPEEQPVLCYHSFDESIIIAFWAFELGCLKKDTYIQWSKSDLERFYDNGEITHWMPLPEVPSE